MNSDYVLQLEFTGTELKVIKSIPIPCNSAVTGNAAITWCTHMFITLSSQFFDVGINYFAVLSPVNCAAVKATTPITSASVRYYALSTVPDVDADNNGYIDSTEN